MAATQWTAGTVCAPNVRDHLLISTEKAGSLPHPPVVEPVSDPIHPARIKIQLSTVITQATQPASVQFGQVHSTKAPSNCHYLVRVLHLSGDPRLF